ncbi:MAG: winged helix-turn-helix domain-containing protein [Gammaproteobacteria bacterium]|nr:winged helix-turn-helix domain-containing protein [Gammaproteobacteria bacterium]
MRYKINGFLLSDNLATAEKGKETIRLTQQEIDALKLFFNLSDNGFVDTLTLESKVWGEQIVTQNSLRKLISGLRLKFGDKESFKNIRGKGYQLSFEALEQAEEHQAINRKPKILLTLVFLISIFVLATLFSNVTTNDDVVSLPKASIQTVFESKDYILDYATHNGALYVTTRGKKSSSVYKTVNRQNKEILSADFPGAFRGIEIHSSGRTVMHVIEDKKCKIRVYEKPIENLIDEVSCNRQNAFPSFDWIDENQFYVSFNVVPTASIRPFVYNLETKRIDKVTDINFNSEDDTRFIDAFIKSYNGGLFSLREDHLDQMSLMYFKDQQRKSIYKYRAKPYSIAVSKDKLVFVGNNNELLQVELSDDVVSQNMKPSLLLAPQAAKIDDPLFLESELYFSTGNSSKMVIDSSSGNFNYSLENGVRDFTYTEGMLSVLAFTNTGYAIEQLKDNKVVSSVYFDSILNLRQIAYFKDEVYLAGASGIYKLEGNTPVLVSELQPVELVSNGSCMIVETKDGIFDFNDGSSNFQKILTQGWRAFASEKECLFVDKLSDEITNTKRESVAKPIMTKLLFEHQGKIYHWHLSGSKTVVTDIETGEVYTEIAERVLNKKMVSYNDDILYLGHDEVNTSIKKLILN